MLPEFEKLEDRVMLSVDLIRPVGSIMIDGNARYTTSLSVKLDVNASDNVAVSDMRFSLDKRNWGDWKPFANTEPVNLLDNGKARKAVYAQFRDSSGNLSKIVGDKIVYDNTIPCGSVEINHGEILTGNPVILLKIKGKDTISGFKHGDVRYSLDSKNWSNWEDFVRKKYISLDNQFGTRNVSMQLRDAAGNVSNVFSDDIVYDIDAFSMIQWMKNHHRKTGLIDSNEGENSFINHWAFIYDEAISVQGLIAAGETRFAGSVLRGIWKIPKRLGGIINAAYSDRIYKGKPVGVEWQVSTGPNAHVGLAYLEYYENVSKKKEFLRYAKSLGDFLLSFQNNNIGNFDYGGIPLGPRGDPNNPADQRIGWNPNNPGLWEIYSTEHQLDSLRLFEKLYDDSGDLKYKTAADKIQGFIKELYDSNRQVFNMGYNSRDKTIDYSIASDVQAWAVSALGNRRIEQITGKPVGNLINAFDSYCKVIPEGYNFVEWKKDIFSPERSLQAVAAKYQAEFSSDVGLVVSKMRELSRQPVFYYAYYTDFTPAENVESGLGLTQKGDSGISHFYFLNILMGHDPMSDIRLF